eukprot:3353959-Alexandrium_andersonii.AAC.1
MPHHRWDPCGKRGEWRHLLRGSTLAKGPTDLPDLYSAIRRARLAAAWGQRHLAAQALHRLQGADLLRTTLRSLRRYRHRRGAWAFLARAWAALRTE